MNESRPAKTVRSVERTLNILFVISGAPQAMTLSEISNASGVDKATALRLLATLESFRLVKRDEASRRYTIGSGAWQLSSSYHSELKSIAEFHMRALRDRTGESVSLVVARGLERVVLTALEASHELRVVPKLNSVVPVYSGASGKVLMAFMPDAERKRIIELTGLKPLNDRALGDKTSFLAALDDVRRDGYAVSIGDVTLGAVALAAPVVALQGELIAVLSLRGPEARLTEDRISQLAPLVAEAAHAIGGDLVGSQPEAAVGGA
jgi:DNA-binding IclR family transcriptional regulator